MLSLRRKLQRSLLKRCHQPSSTSCSLIKRLALLPRVHAPPSP
jgi:hypothetical protein